MPTEVDGAYALKIGQSMHLAFLMTVKMCDMTWVNFFKIPATTILLPNSCFSFPNAVLLPSFSQITVQPRKLQMSMDYFVHLRHRVIVAS
jgi:hypothetical protein